MKWTKNIKSGYLSMPHLTIGEEFLHNFEMGKCPKIHWCMQLDRWQGLVQPYIRVQCQSHQTKYMMYFDDYDTSPIEFRCKHCSKQFLKMKKITDSFQIYKFYDLYDMKAFVCKLNMRGFNTFDIDYLYMSCENNKEKCD